MHPGSAASPGSSDASPPSHSPAASPASSTTMTPILTGPILRPSSTASGPSASTNWQLTVELQVQEVLLQAEDQLEVEEVHLAFDHRHVEQDPSSRQVVGAEVPQAPGSHHSGNLCMQEPTAAPERIVAPASSCSALRLQNSKPPDASQPGLLAPEMWPRVNVMGVKLPLGWCSNWDGSQTLPPTQKKHYRKNIKHLITHQTLSEEPVPPHALLPFWMQFRQLRTPRRPSRHSASAHLQSSCPKPPSPYVSSVDAN